MPRIYCDFQHTQSIEVFDGEDRYVRMVRGKTFEVLLELMKIGQWDPSGRWLTVPQGTDLGELKMAAYKEFQDDQTT